MNGKRISAVAAFAVLVVLALVGCSTSTTANHTAQQTLHLSMTTAQPTFAIGAYSGGTSYVYTGVYDSIVSMNAKGQIIPMIATSWNYTDGNTTLTFHIRPGMKFTDGQAVNAQAVAGSLTAEWKGTASSAVYAAVSSIDAPDSSTVVLHLSRPDASLLPSLAIFYGAVAAPGHLNPGSGAPVGSGPYTLDMAATNVGSVYTLKKNPGYWNANAYGYDTIVVQVISDPTAAVNGVLDGQLDWTDIQPNQRSLFSKSKFTIGVNPPSAVIGIWIADRRGQVVPALADVRVRQAINLAIDRKAIAEKANSGALAPTAQMVLPPTGTAYDPAKANAYAFNVQKARQLMAAAGYAHGFTVTMPSVAGFTTSYEPIISQELSNIGIKVDWQTLSYAQFDERIIQKAYGMFISANGLPGDAASILSLLSYPQFNPFASTTPELEALVNSANKAPLDQQGLAFRKVNDYLINQAWFAPIGYATGYWVAPKSVQYTPPLLAAQSVTPWQPAQQ